MPKGIYKRNEEEILRLRKLRLGITPWNKGKKRPPFTEEWIANMKKSAKKRNPPTEETKTKISESNCKPCHLKTDTWGTKKELTKLPKQWKKI